MCTLGIYRHNIVRYKILHGLDKNAPNTYHGIVHKEESIEELSWYKFPNVFKYDYIQWVFLLLINLYFTGK